MILYRISLFNFPPVPCRNIKLQKYKDEASACFTGHSYQLLLFSRPHPFSDFRD